MKAIQYNNLTQEDLVCKFFDGNKYCKYNYLDSNIEYNTVTSRFNLDKYTEYREFRQLQNEVLPLLYEYVDSILYYGEPTRAGSKKIYNFICDLNRDVKFNLIREMYEDEEGKIPIVERYFPRLQNLGVKKTSKEILLPLILYFLRGN